MGAISMHSYMGFLGKTGGEMKTDQNVEAESDFKKRKKEKNVYTFTFLLKMKSST